MATVGDALAVGQRARVSVGSGGYSINGVKFRRTTRVIGGIPRPALERWKKKNTVKETLKFAPGLSSLDIETAAGVVMEKRTGPSDAMLAGTRVHQAIEDALLGTPQRNQASLTQADRKKARAGWQFCKRYVHSPIPEITVFNPEARVSGTVDIYDSAPPGRIFDFKTGGLYETAALQVVLYGRFMTRCIIPDKDRDPAADHIDGTIEKWGPIHEMVLVRLSDAGNALPKVIKEEMVTPALDTIKSCLTISAFCEIKKRELWSKWPLESQ